MQTSEPVESGTSLPACPSLKDSPQRWWLAALLTLGMIFCYAQRGTLSVAAPFMMKERNLSPAAMGLLLSALFWSYSFMQVPAGWLVDRFGVKRAYAAGFAFRSTGVVLVAGVLSYVLLISQRVEMTETIPAQ